ncbi:hypothetical protein SAMN04489742_0084 [Arthrobacter crystallopoietes]|jgi:hypothetical protein|uniref:Uncharacterized protein n=3 Tax=Micrococcaceae TaxID=1268 RepID=Q6SK47_PAEAU|nr:hypothetical protein [Paenarthrobacter aurescens]SDQ03419.1 hypothetical protein SAMN04489742_0084 [Arthrobacter crystallopoietes]
MSAVTTFFPAVLGQCALLTARYSIDVSCLDGVVARADASGLRAADRQLDERWGRWSQTGVYRRLRRPEQERIGQYRHMRGRRLVLFGTLGGYISGRRNMACTTVVAMVSAMRCPISGALRGLVARSMPFVIVMPCYRCWSPKTSATVIRVPGHAHGPHAGNEEGEGKTSEDAPPGSRPLKHRCKTSRKPDHDPSVVDEHVLPTLPTHRGPGHPISRTGVKPRPQTRRHS